MRVIILGSVNCPHCRALVRLLKSVQDITSISYVEFEHFLNHSLSTEDKEKFIDKYKTTSINLPLSFYNNGSGWKQLQTENYTKRLLVRYAKELVQKNGLKQ